jgi:alkaline phosphatase
VALLVGAFGPVYAANAKSAILFIGDGMGPMQIHIARAAKGGERLTMQTFPFSGYATTHPAEGEVTDSAAAGTALATGVKTKNGMLGLTPEGARLTNIMERARAAGKATGIITTDALWGATPAAFGVHVPSRYEYAEISAQQAASKADVMMGYGKDYLLPKAAGGEREDGRNLIAEMKQAGYTVVETRAQFAQAPAEGKLLGLFQDGKEKPALRELVAAAYARLARDPEGFVLMVEGARIDWMGHSNDPAGVVLETAEFDDAITEALNTSRAQQDVLIVVTADHETGGLTLEDGSRLGALRRVTMSSGGMTDALSKARDNIQQTLSKGAGLTDLTRAEIASIRESKEPAKAIAKVVSERSGLSWASVGHTATRVRVFAYGPGAQQFTNGLDNTDVPKRMETALGLIR